MYSASAERNNSYALLHMIGRSSNLASWLAPNSVTVAYEGEAAFAKHYTLLPLVACFQLCRQYPHAKEILFGIWWRHALISNA
jgi:hypothetical protein